MGETKYNNSDVNVPNIYKNLEKIEKVGEDFKHREDTNARGHRHQTGMHVLVGGQLLILDTNQLLQELVSPGHLIS